jgi:hypothetical protein
MLRNLAAALLATTLIAGPAFAAETSGTAGSTPATQTAPAAAATVKPAVAAQPVKMAKHTAKHVRKHYTRSKAGSMHQARHVKPAKTHQANIAKSTKPIDGGRPRA